MIKYPDYSNCITNLACSVLKEFGIECGHESLKLCDDLLSDGYQNIVILLLDGMGQIIVDRNLDRDGFFRKHLAGTYSSVFPPTTVAATTSADSGKNPVEHSWLGWDCYYREIDKNVTVFMNTESGTDRQAADINVARTYCPYRSIADKIKESGQQAYYASPFMEPYPESFEQICENVVRLCGIKGKKYIYCYWPEPDSTMHRKGCYCDESIRVLRSLEQQTEELCARLKDTLLIVTADHGMIDSKGAAIAEYPEILICLERMPSIEPRALNLYVKAGMERKLEQEFNQEFGDKFLLMNRKQVRESMLFGTGDEHERFDEMLGDYLAAATGDLSIFNSAEERDSLIGVHAGLTEDEMMIPFIAVSVK